ncbi:IS3 family transposase [Azonexus sp.]|jgi:transposase InsO family protein|uniref:IS3 family transposase n=1 Tax=Azonexus sp. TaxID=1872668 RepID=UPI00282D929B|nr:DDE-type integrase/transposase/recombinase [Azonexus sp.]MDR1995348.1 DDE-type integrase/transposase/recombinase [Azonexus sp.]
MTTDFPTAPSAYGLNGPSAHVTVEKSQHASHTEILTLPMTADIATDALTMAWFRKRPTEGLVHHSDRGSQYASHAFQDKLKAYGMTCSMSRKGNCWDNAPTESWFNSFKNERVHGIRYATHVEIKAATFEYIEVFYNRKRQHSTLGYKSPLQFLETWIRQQHHEKRVA